MENTLKINTGLGILLIVLAGILIMGCTDKDINDINAVTGATATPEAPHCSDVTRTYCGYCLDEQVSTLDTTGSVCVSCPAGYTCPADYCYNNVTHCIPVATPTPEAPNCPAKQGEVYCGYCANIDQCVYCPQGDICPSDYCTNDWCPRGSNGGGGGSTPQKKYYIGCSECPGQPGVSYNGPSYEICYGYYVACYNAGCGKILDNCR